MRNLLSGTKYLEHVGPLVLKSNTGLRCDLDFKEAGFWGSSQNVVSGVVKNDKGKTVAQLEGKWSEGLSMVLDPQGNHLRVLWRANPFPPHALDYYGFTSFTTTLNELLPSLAPHLPLTDSRLRPDQRALEDGCVDEAEAEKLRVEEGQRKRRAGREARGEDWTPRWFERAKGSKGDDGGEWVYKGGYWETRAEGKWVGVEPLW